MANEVSARASALLALGRFAEARTLLRAHLGTEPADAEALCQLARAELGLGNPAECVQASHEAMRIDPEREWAHRLAALALARLKRYDEACFEAETAIRLAPFAWEPRVTRATVDISSKRVSAYTESTAREAVRLAPHQPEAHLAVASTLIALKRPAQAEPAVREALRLDPNSNAAHNELARVQLLQKRYGSAASGFVAAAALQPTDAVARANLVVAAYQLVRRVSLILVLVTAVVFRIHDDQGHVSLVAIRVGWLISATLIGIFLLRMKQQLGARAVRIALLTARLSKTLAVWSIALAAGFVLLGAAAVTPRDVSKVCQVWGLVMVVLAIIMSYASIISVRRAQRRRPKS